MLEITPRPGIGMLRDEERNRSQTEGSGQLPSESL